MMCGPPPLQPVPPSMRGSTQSQRSHGPQRFAPLDSTPSRFPQNQGSPPAALQRERHILPLPSNRDKNSTSQPVQDLAYLLEKVEGGRSHAIQNALYRLEDTLESGQISLTKEDKKYLKKQENLKNTLYDMLPNITSQDSKPLYISTPVRAFLMEAVACTTKSGKKTEASSAEKAFDLMPSPFEEAIVHTLTTIMSEDAQPFQVEDALAILNDELEKDASAQNNMNKMQKNLSPLAKKESERIERRVGTPEDAQEQRLGSFFANYIPTEKVDQFLRKFVTDNVNPAIVNANQQRETDTPLQKALHAFSIDDQSNSRPAKLEALAQCCPITPEDSPWFEQQISAFIVNHHGQENAIAATLLQALTNAETDSLPPLSCAILAKYFPFIDEESNAHYAQIGENYQQGPPLLPASYSANDFGTYDTVNHSIQSPTAREQRGTQSASNQGEYDVLQLDNLNDNPLYGTTVPAKIPELIYATVDKQERDMNVPVPLPRKQKMPSSSQEATYSTIREERTLDLSDSENTTSPPVPPKTETLIAEGKALTPENENWADNTSLVTETPETRSITSDDQDDELFFDAFEEQPAVTNTDEAEHSSTPSPNPSSPIFQRPNSPTQSPALSPSTPQIPEQFRPTSHGTQPSRENAPPQEGHYEEIPAQSQKHPKPLVRKDAVRQKVVHGNVENSFSSAPSKASSGEQVNPNSVNIAPVNAILDINTFNGLVASSFLFGGGVICFRHPGDNQPVCRLDITEASELVRHSNYDEEFIGDILKGFSREIQGILSLSGEEAALLLNMSSAEIAEQSLKGTNLVASDISSHMFTFVRGEKPQVKIHPVVERRERGKAPESHFLPCIIFYKTQNDIWRTSDPSRSEGNDVSSIQFWFEDNKESASTKKQNSVEKIKSFKNSK